MPSSILQHSLESQPLEVRDCDVFDGCLLDPSPLSGHQVPHVKDRHGFIAAEVAATVMREESVHLPFGLILGGKGGGIHRNQLLILGCAEGDLLLVLHI